MLPSHQRFHPHEISALDLDFRLIENSQLTLFDRAPQLGLQLQAPHRGQVHRRIENLIARFAARLRLIHRDVGVTNQIDRRIVALTERDADADGAEDFVRPDLER